MTDLKAFIGKVASGEHLSEALVAICGTAPFLAAFLRRHPAWLSRLLAEERTHAESLWDRTNAGDDAQNYPIADRAALRAKLRLQVSSLAAPADRVRALRHFKYYESAT